MSTTPSAGAQDAAHWQHLARIEREDAIARLVAAAEASERIAALAEYPSDELLAAGDRIAALGPQLRAALEAYRRTL